MSKSKLTLLAVCSLLVLALMVGCAAPAATPTAAPTAPSAATTAAPTAAPAMTPAPTQAAQPAKKDVILATTTSTQDSGLLDVLLPMFEEQTGYVVKPIAVGSGQAMKNGERGDADVLLVHAPDAEKKFMEDGHGIDRKLVMHNDFLIVGPEADPAQIKGLKDTKEALEKIANAEAMFVSRGDNSGTDQLEKKLWTLTQVEPVGKTWYMETGQGMGATLKIASEQDAYTITDRGTYLAQKQNLILQPMVEGDTVLLNIYHVIQVNPNKSDRINAEGAKAFAEFMVAEDTQKVIETFGVDKFGEPLFYPDAGKPEYN